MATRVLARASFAHHRHRHHKLSLLYGPRRHSGNQTQHRHHRSREIVPESQPVDPLHYEQLFQQFQKKERVVLITGAGVSTESGIPDYRSPNGSYSKGHVPMKYQEFVNSELNRKRYWARSVVGFKQFVSVSPNAGHKAIAALESAGFISNIITQNVDRLHQAAGSRNVLELHGHIDQIHCLRCHKSEPRWAYQELLQYENDKWLKMIKPISKYGEQRADADAELGITNEIYEQFRVPSCSSCGGILKPSVVFFGESIPKAITAESIRLVEEADAVVCAGTSMQVYSVYRLALAAVGKLDPQHDDSNSKKKRPSRPIYIINIGPTRADELATLKISSRVGEVFSALKWNLNV